MRVAKSYVGYEYDETKAYEKNGKIYVSARCKCDRCNGSGIAISHVCNGQPVPYVNDGGICYSCNGAGYFRKEIRLYTDKEFEQMEKASAKAAEKREAAREQKMKAEYANKRAKWLEENGFNENLTTFVYFPADSFEIKDSLKDAGFKFNRSLLWHIANIPEGYEDKVVEIALNQVAEIGAWGEGFYRPGARTFVDDILKNCRPIEESTSEWLFEEKERFYDYAVVLKSVRGMETRFGWTQLVKFEDANGNILQWWTAVEIKAEVGDQVLLTGTVKAHDEYKGVKSTTVTRCKIKAV